MITEISGEKEKESRKLELQTFRGEIAAYLKPPYFFEVPDDPARPGNYQKTGNAMARINNTLEIKGKIELLMHPKKKLVSDKSRELLSKNLNILTLITTPGWLAEMLSKHKDDARIPPDLMAKIAADVAAGDQLDREYRVRAEMIIIRNAIKAILLILDKELAK